MNAVQAPAKMEGFVPMVSIAIVAHVLLDLSERTVKPTLMTVLAWQIPALTEELVAIHSLLLFVTVLQAIRDIVVKLAVTYVLTTPVKMVDVVNIDRVVTMDITANAYREHGVRGARKTSMNATITHA